MAEDLHPRGAEAPAAWMRPGATERTPACAEITIGANMASPSRVIFAASPIPSRMITSGK